MLYRRPQEPIDFINDFRKDQGKYLRVYRAMLNITQADAANEFGVTPLTWLRWEANRAEMKVVSLAKFARIWNGLWPEVA